jgi:peptidoglycan/LPS O-acetylase OafA/YrhL
MIVVLYHFTFYSKLKNVMSQELLQTFPLSFCVSGVSAVCLFFILSGYVLSYRFIGEGKMAWRIIEAVIKRPIRLIGVVLFGTYAGFLLYAINGGYVEIDAVLKQSFVSPFSSGLNVNEPLWTISIELYGSFITFAVCFFISNFSKKIRALLLIVLCVCLKDTYYMAFVFGVLIADLQKNYMVNFFIRYKNALSYAIFIPAILLFSYGMTPEFKRIPNIDYIQSGYSMLGSILIFIFIMCNNPIKNILNHKLLVFIGGISYSLYAVHYLVQKYFVKSIYLYFTQAMKYDVNICFWAIFLVSTAIIIFIAWLTDKYIDKPCIKFSSWFAKKLVTGIQLRIEASKIIKPCSRHMKTLLTNLRKKFIRHPRM